MGSNDYTWFFIFMSLFNTNLGMSNIEKNDNQYERQIRIEAKLDRILEILDAKQ